MDLIEQKANELVDKFYVPIMKGNYPNVGQLSVAIQCAIIGVDEIIASHENKSPNYKNETYWHPIDFYQQVKERLLAKQ